MIRYYLLIIIALFVPCLSADLLKTKEAWLRYTYGDNDYEFFIFAMPESVLGKNLALLNNNNPEDRIFYFRHLIDLKCLYTYGRESHGYDVLQAKIGLRSRAEWGNLNVFRTTTNTICDTGILVPDEHWHELFFAPTWIRELWLSVNLSDLLCLPFCNKHTFTIGAFPFELGRGISLGLIYPSVPQFIGFYPDIIVDQYIFGAKISGDVIKNYLTYDLYGALYENKAGFFRYTSEPIRGNQYEHCKNRARGFGVIHYVAAARCFWRPYQESEKQTLLFEPYMLYDYNPALDVEFTDMAISNLGTAGFAGEFVYKNFEFGFECARNFGGQQVAGIDRNVKQFENRDGTLTEVNSNVIDTTTNQLALVTPANQCLIDCSNQTETQNLQPLSNTLTNSDFRFRDPYYIKYTGSFFIVDASYWLIPDKFKINGAFGYASGDSDPYARAATSGNNTIEYNGFITIDESYNGKRVVSVLVLAFGVFPRIGDVIDETSLNILPASSVRRFSDLVLAGVSADMYTTLFCKQLHINPNILCYWQDHQTERLDRLTFDPNTNPRFLNQFLGTEYNLIIEYDIIKDGMLFVIPAVFVPGKHYKQLQGVPLTPEQERYDLDLKSGIPNNPREPLIGADPAFVLNIGLQYSF
jgi:hypothetical protein